MVPIDRAKRSSLPISPFAACPVSFHIMRSNVRQEAVAKERYEAIRNCCNVLAIGAQASYLRQIKVSLRPIPKHRHLGHSFTLDNALHQVGSNDGLLILGLLFIE